MAVVTVYRRLRTGGPILLAALLGATPALQILCADRCVPEPSEAACHDADRTGPAEDACADHARIVLLAAARADAAGASGFHPPQPDGHGPAGFLFVVVPSRRTPRGDGHSSLSALPPHAPVTAPMRC